MKKPRQFHNLTAYTCTHTQDGKEHSVTLYGVDEAEVLRSNRPHYTDLTVEGPLLEEYDDQSD